MPGALASITAWESSHGTIWGILAEELLVGERGVIELLMIILRAVEELTECWVHLAVVLRVLDIEVRDPAELAIDVSLLG